MSLQIHKSLTGYTLIESHRGSSYLGSENSWPAIEYAHQVGADLIEIDVQISRDNVPFVRHNYLLPDERLCGTLNWSELATFRTNKGEPIPRLDDILHWANKTGACLSLDMKGSFGMSTRLYENVMRLIQESRMKEQVLILDWNHFALKHVKQSDSKILTRALIRGRPVNLLEMLQAINADAVSLSYDMICSEDVLKVQKAGIAVALVEMWRPDFDLAEQLGVDIVSWENPAEARSAIHRL